MPSRFSILVILGFWCASTGWYFFREIRPRLQTPDGPPPISVDLADEAREQRSHWSVNGDSWRGYAETWVDYQNKDDTFDTHGLLKLWMDKTQQGNADVVAKSRFNVTREGEIHEIEIKLMENLWKQEIIISVAGPVKKGKFTATPEVEIGNSAPFKPGPVELQLPPRGTVYDSFFPVNRMTGLYPGRRWRVPVMDASTLPTPIKAFVSAPLYLDAEVLSGRDWLDWPPHRAADRPPTACLVVEYTDEQTREPTERTWVRESDGLVVRQEMTYRGLIQKVTKVTLERDEN